MQKTPRMVPRFEETALKKSLPSWSVPVVWPTFAVQAARPVVAALPTMNATKTVYTVTLWTIISSNTNFSTLYVAFVLNTFGTKNGSTSVVGG